MKSQDVEVQGDKEGSNQRICPGQHVPQVVAVHPDLWKLKIAANTISASADDQATESLQSSF